MPKINKEKPKIIYNNNLPLLFADSFEVNIRQDNIVFIRFLSRLPDGAYEEARIMVQQERSKILIDALCEMIEHYPKKPDQNKIEKKKRK